MPVLGEGAAVNFRPSRFVNGGSPEQQQQQQQQQHGGSSSLYSDGSGAFSRRSVSGGASSAAAMRMYLPLLGLVLVAGVMLATGSSWLHHSTAHMQSPERLSSTIEQLSQNQAQMMAMLQRLSTTANGGGGGAGSNNKDAAGAAAAAGSSSGGSTSSNAEPTTAAFAAIPVLTQLHNKLLRKSHAYEEHRKVMLDTFEQLVHMEPAAAEEAMQQQLAAGSTGAMQTFTLQLYRLLLSTGKLLPCREDTTLKVNDPMPRDGGGGGHWYSHHGHHASSSSSAASSAPRYFFATNLRDNTVNMPQFMLSLLQTLLRLPHGSAFVSAYESNSDDGAHGWVDVLQLALNVIGTPSDLVTRGMLVRLEGSNRIQHLARVRNMALAPLYQHYATTRSRGTQAGSGSSGNGTAAAASSSGRRSLQTSDLTEQQQWASPLDSSPGSGRRLQGDALSALASASSADTANGLPGVLPWDPDYVVFVNDAFFCWSMVHRLLNYRADITCGADFWQNADATVELPADLASKNGRRKPHIPAEYRLERPIREPLSPDQDNPIVFYDVWVARDLSGAKFWWTYPFVHDATTTAAAQKGLPFRASCCWNGLAVLRAAPFAAGLRIRPPIDQGECQGSECTMLCNDFARLGYQDVVVDVGVQMTYDWRLAREMLALGIEGIGQTTWAQAKAAGIAGHTRKPAYAAMECCGLKSRFTQWVNFNTDCYQEDVFARNWTQRVLAGGV